MAKESWSGAMRRYTLRGRTQIVLRFHRGGRFSKLKLGNNQFTYISKIFGVCPYRDNVLIHHMDCSQTRSELAIMKT